MDCYEITAYHEAGHAVMASLLGGQVRQVTIVPDDEEELGLSGDTQVAWDMRGIGRREHAVREMKTLLAGPVVESIYLADPDPFRVTGSSSLDWLAASEFAATIISRRDARKDYLHHMTAELWDFFRRDQPWSVVAAVADELQAHESLDNESLQEVVGFWLRHCGG